MAHHIQIFRVLTSLMFLTGCNDEKKSGSTVVGRSSSTQKEVSVQDTAFIKEIPNGIDTPAGMVWIPGGIIEQGAVPGDQMAMEHEKPVHRVAIDGFFMDNTEVTNAEFKAFVDATKYATVAEREIDWEEMRKQLPEGTPKPHDSIMRPGSLTFKKTSAPVRNLYDFSQWWQWTIGANWKHPDGPESSLIGKGNEPVVHIAYEDALAYCEWAGRRLPTEAEWERAARGNHTESVYSWGDNASEVSEKANTWQGNFPITDTKADGFGKRAPVKSYPPNDFGIYDMAGNVWEWTTDWYDTGYYARAAETKTIEKNPQGATHPHITRETPTPRKKSLKADRFCATLPIVRAIVFRREWQQALILL